MYKYINKMFLNFCKILFERYQLLLFCRYYYVQLWGKQNNENTKILVRRSREVCGVNLKKLILDSQMFFLSLPKHFSFLNIIYFTLPEFASPVRSRCSFVPISVFTT